MKKQIPFAREHKGDNCNPLFCHNITNSFFSIPFYLFIAAHTCPKKSTNVAAFPTDFCLSLTTLPELNFTQARSRCIENGQDLAAIPGESTRERLETLLDSCPLTG